MFDLIVLIIGLLDVFSLILSLFYGEGKSRLLTKSMHFFLDFTYVEFLIRINFFLDSFLHVDVVVLKILLFRFDSFIDKFVDSTNSLFWQVIILNLFS